MVIGASVSEPHLSYSMCPHVIYTSNEKFCELKGRIAEKAKETRSGMFWMHR